MLAHPVAKQNLERILTTVLLAAIALAMAALATVRASAQVEHGHYSDNLTTPDPFLHMATLAVLRRPR